MNDEKYDITLIKREFQQSSDDYHATVIRRSDGKKLIWTARWRWLLKIYIRRRALDRWFDRHDKRRAQLAKVEEYSL